jgi:hypothetical protein
MAVVRGNARIGFEPLLLIPETGNRTLPEIEDRLAEASKNN